MKDIDEKVDKIGRLALTIGCLQDKLAIMKQSRRIGLTLDGTVLDLKLSAEMQTAIREAVTTFCGAELDKLRQEFSELVK